MSVSGSTVLPSDVSDDANTTASNAGPSSFSHIVRTSAAITPWLHKLVLDCLFEQEVCVAVDHVLPVAARSRCPCLVLVASTNRRVVRHMSG